MLKKVRSNIKKAYKRARKASRNIRDTIAHHKRRHAAKKHAPQRVVEKTPSNEERVIVEFSIMSIVKTTITILLLVSLVDFIGYIKEPLYVILFAFFLAAVFDPLVDILEKYKIPRGLGIIIIYVLVIGILATILISLVPILFQQITEIGGNIGKYINNIFSTGDYPFADRIQPFVQQLESYVEREQIVGTIQDSLSQLGSGLRDVATNTVGAVVSVFYDVINMIFVLVLTFFIVIDKAGVKRFFLSLFPKKHGHYVSDKINTIQKKIGEWVRGQLLLCLSIAILTFIGLSILGVNYALTLALVAGITELIPYVGPTLACLVALPIAFNQSPFLIIWVMVLYIIIQQVENNVLVPIIMRQAVGLSPIVVLLAMIIGAKTFGIIGIILAVPVATIAAIFLHDYSEKMENSDK